MERIQDTKGLEYKDFEIPSSVEEKTVCTRDRTPCRKQLSCYYRVFLKRQCSDKEL